MLTSVKQLKNYKLKSLNGEIGKVKDIYFDDDRFNVSYIVADTGKWLSTRMVLISPYSIKGLDKFEEYISVDLTTNQIEESPPLESDKPLSRQYQEKLSSHFDYPLYWRGIQTASTGIGNIGFIPQHLMKEDAIKRSESIGDDELADPNLRSMNQVKGYHVQSIDDEIGHIEDFIIDSDNWRIRYLVVEIQNLLPGKKVLISPEWMKDIKWKDSIVALNLSSEDIKKSEEYDENLVIKREYEKRLHEHYKRERYWSEISRKNNTEYL